jgi:cytochrome c551/c552
MRALPALVALFALAAPAAHAQSAADLLKARGCTNCHDATTRKVGPSLADIATRHKADAAAADRIVSALREGKGHPKVAATEAEIRTMVAFILRGR